MGQARRHGALGATGAPHTFAGKSFYGAAPRLRTRMLSTQRLAPSACPAFAGGSGGSGGRHGSAPHVRGAGAGITKTKDKCGAFGIVAGVTSYQGVSGSRRSLLHDRNGRRVMIRRME